MRNAKFLLLAAVSALSAVGCTIESQNMIPEVPYDFSDYAYYDKPFATSPNYREEAPAIYTAHAVARDAGPTAVPAKADIISQPSAPQPRTHTTMPLPVTPPSVHAASVASHNAIEAAR